MRLWGELYGKAEIEGKSLPLMDSLVMACAASRNMTIKSVMFNSGTMDTSNKVRSIVTDFLFAARYKLC